jgi:hypothetical protein
VGGRGCVGRERIATGNTNPAPLEIDDPEASRHNAPRTREGPHALRSEGRLTSLTKGA